MNVEKYLKENIDEYIEVKPWKDPNNLPVFLRNHYNLYELEILGTRCILAEVINEKPSINELQKHITQMTNLTNCPIVLLYRDISVYRRKSLIKKRIAFVIHDGQMYIPFLTLDLKKTRKFEEIEIKSFTIPAQVAYLHFLYHKETVVNVSEFAELMGFSKMTASRALNDLYHANLITYDMGGRTGRSKEYKRIQDPEYFMRGKEYLKTPVRKTVHTKVVFEGALMAGLQALAELTMINPPGHQVLAIDRNQFVKEDFEILKNHDMVKDSQFIEIQLWDYDPKLFSDQNHVDLVSLFASFKDETDERVEEALEEILRGERWYTG